MAARTSVASGAGADGTTTRRYTAAVIDWTPQPIASSVGPLAVHWHAITCAVGFASTSVVARQARRRGVAGRA